MSKKLKTLEERFWSKVDKETCLGARCACQRGMSHCWPWLANPSNVYGTIRVFVDDHWESHLAHRISYEFAFGAIPDGLFVCHECDNPRCCNPQHLWLGTALDNAHDTLQKGHYTGDFLREQWRNNEYRTKHIGQKHHNAKLTDANVREIIRLRGIVTGRELARQFSVSPQTICYVQRGPGWQHIHGDTFEMPSRIRCNKLTDAQALEIFSLKGIEHSTILAKRYNIDRGTIYKIQMGKSYKHIHQSGKLSGNS